MLPTFLTSVGLSVCRSFLMLNRLWMKNGWTLMQLFLVTTITSRWIFLVPSFGESAPLLGGSVVARHFASGWLSSVVTLSSTQASSSVDFLMPLEVHILTKSFPTFLTHV